ncbi:MAG TPA: trypsin-like serine protease [Acidimicrobiia bacterium]|nr:trypsin-like serine protease [Acidimicrobiia bacterium]
MLRRAAIAAIALTLVLPATAGAVWGGAPDGNDHPSVGAMYFDFDQSGTIDFFELVCSGSHAGTHNGYDVFLTAGHCLPPAELGIPAAALAVSYDSDGSDGVASPISAEQYHVMPGFGHDLGDLRDLGVLLLPAGSVDAAFGSPPPVQLPTAGYLDELKRAGELKFRIVEVVGYGVTPDWDTPGPTTFELDGVRKSGTSIITGLRKANVLYNQNRNGIGTGSGVCFGDSGSPQLDQGTLTVMSVTSGGNGQCNANSYNYRVDTPAARAFLGQFIALP